MSKLSTNALIIIAIASLVLTVLFTYLWATLAAPVSTVFSVLVFVAAVCFLVCINWATKN